MTHVDEPLKVGRIDWADPAAKRSFNRSLFTEVAPTYDRLTRWLSFGQDRAWKRLLIDRLPPLSAPDCLDLACGTGDLTLALHRKYPQGRVIGLDLNPEMLALARSRPHPSRVHFRAGDMSATGCPAAAFDIVTGGYALRNAPDLDQTLREIFRVLRPGGTASFLDFSKSHRAVPRYLSGFLLRAWGSLWGWLLHRNPDVYAYIAASLEHYPDRRSMLDCWQRAGFIRVRRQRLFFGFLEILTGERPA